MKVRGISGRDRRAIMIGLAVVVPVAFAMLVARPYVESVRSASERIEIERELLARERALVEEAAFHPEVFAAASRTLLETAPRLFPPAEPSIAVAALSGYVHDAARDARVHVSRATPAAAAAPPGIGLSAFALEVSAEGDLEGILTFLSALEDGPRLVRVERARIEASGRAEIPQEPGVQVLRLTARVTAFALADLAGEGRRAGADH